MCFYGIQWRWRRRQGQRRLRANGQPLDQVIIFEVIIVPVTILTDSHCMHLGATALEPQLGLRCRRADCRPAAQTGESSCTAGIAPQTAQRVHSGRASRATSFRGQRRMHDCSAEQPIPASEKFRPSGLLRRSFDVMSQPGTGGGAVRWAAQRRAAPGDRHRAGQQPCRLPHHRGAHTLK